MITAQAYLAILVVNCDMPELTCGTTGAAAYPAVPDDAGADSGGDLDVDHLLACGGAVAGPEAAEEVFAKCAEVSVVIYQDWDAAEPGSESLSWTDSIPASQQRG